jgi:hypothetical protein
MLSHGIAPASALEATIFSIRKGGDGSDPLNYRPIALLNTDYKLFTRIIAWRVSALIPSMVHPTQFGFVPGRSIYDAIDLFEAAKNYCAERPDTTAAQVQFLDFAKAYDSLDRTFLLIDLKQKGFSQQFCRMVDTLHTDTKVQFMANGARSKSIKVTSGIRQGCPLAPLLFILAADVLYDEVEATSELRGIDIYHGTGAGS